MDNVPMVMFRGKLLDPKHYISNKNKLSQEDLYPKFVRWSHDILDKNGKIIFKAGDVIQGASIVMNYDMENLTTQLFQSIKSQKLDYNFLYIRSVVDDNGKVINGNYLYSYHPTRLRQIRSNNIQYNGLTTYVLLSADYLLSLEILIRILQTLKTLKNIFLNYITR